MDEKDSMTPDTIPQSTPVDGTVPAGRKNRRPVVIGVAAVAAAALVAGGVCGCRAYENHRVSMAREACQSAVANLNKAVKSYKALLGADSTTAALKTDATSVKDAKTLDTLKQAAEVETPGMVKCDASDKTGLDAAAAKADKTAKGVKAAAKAVESSKLDKTVADADGLYKATEGNVQDEKTREALKQAIAKRDAGAIAKAVKSVNDSKAAKEKADAEAKEKAEQEAAEQEAAAQAAAEAAAAQSQTQQSYSAPRQSYTPSYSGGSTSGGGGSSSVPDFVPSSGGLGCTTDCPPSSSDGLIHH